MAGRRRSAPLDDRDSSPDDAFDVSRSSKRRRVTPQAQEPLSQSPLFPTGYLSQPAGPHADGAQKGPLVHQPGSIVRVKLANFVTYTAVEISPGPSLNMVIGPNGTGKSTLVCAICLGLGWAPKFLGRQKEYSEFVKNGEREASIEIELCRGPSRSRNPVIRCEIRKEGSRADFFINGTRTKQKLVQQLARKFSIQIDNLCQFLPQDKVVEFAAMSPIELLESTQEAVASKQMIAWHHELKGSRAEQKEMERSQTTYKETLTNLEGRQRMQEADVARMREREQHKENVRLWKSVRPFAEYGQALARYQDHEREYKQTSRSLKRLEEDLEPTLRAAHEKAIYRDVVMAAAENRRRGAERAEQQAQACAKSVEDLNEKIGQLDAATTKEKKNAKGINMEKARHMNSINEVRRRMNEAPPEFDATFHNERIHDRNRALLEKENSITEIIETIRRMETDVKERSIKIARAKQELAGLDTQAGQQANKLARSSPDAYEAWNHIKEHAADFEKPVYGPPIIECSVKDPRYVNLIESLFQSSNFLAITTQTHADFERLQAIVYDELKLHNVPIREVSSGLERFRSTVSVDEMKQYGFDGWAIDFLSGPEPVLAMLCDDVKLHQTGVSLQDTSSDQYRTLENSIISSWATRNSIYRIARRKEYGPGAVSTTVRDTRSAQYWTDQPVDPQAKQAIERRIFEWSDEHQQLRRGMSEYNSRKDEASEARNTLRVEINNFKSEKEAAQKASSEYRALPTKKEQYERKLASVDSQLRDIRERIQRNNVESDKHLLAKGQGALDCAVAVEDMRRDHDTVLEAELMLIEASSDHEVLVERNKTVRNQLKERQLEVKNLEESQQASRQRAAELGRRVKKAKKIAQQSDDTTLLNFIEEHGKKSPEDIDAEIDSEQARLELLHEGSGRIIEEFEDREKKIAEYQEKLQSIENTIAEKDTQIRKIRSQWEPKLDNLMKRISDSFAFNMKQINCAGEVSIEKDDDFDKWAVRINVKFREEEALTQLDSHRQSGGERAVSTIFYLMSLQSLTRSPFRVVDEINQGMDPRNERLVHSRMVAIATGNDEWQDHYERNLATSNTDADDGLQNSEDEDGEEGVSTYKASGSQYFLITPKLLHGLRYEPGMKVLCIASGEYMPENEVKASFSTSLQIRKGMTVIPIVG